MTLWYKVISFVYAVKGSMAFCTPEGENDTKDEVEGAIFPENVQIACNNCFVIPW